jgi:hypothetical protein
MGAVHGKHTMLRIYDEALIRRRYTLKRLQMFVLFGGGALCGLWLAQHGGSALLTEAIAARAADTPPVAARWCTGETTPGLRLDCSLSVPELPRAQDL